MKGVGRLGELFSFPTVIGPRFLYKHIIRTISLSIQNSLNMFKSKPNSFDLAPYSISEILSQLKSNSFNRMKLLTLDLLGLKLVDVAGLSPDLPPPPRPWDEKR